MQRLPLEELVALAGDFLPFPRKDASRRRIFTPWATFWIFLSQVLGPARTCREALQGARAWLQAREERDISPNTSAYCQARARLATASLGKVFRALRGNLKKTEEPCWMNRLVRVVDGTSLSMPDTPSNQRLYPQSSRQKAGCGFPLMRLVAVFSLSNGSILGVAKGAMDVDERTLWRGLWRLFEKGSVALADRGFCGFADYCRFLERGVDAVMRLHGRRSSGVRKIARLAKRDWLVEWKKTSVCPKWMTQEEWRALPTLLQVRHIEVSVPIGGFRTQTLTIATTILDAKTYPARRFADLYRQRWMAELFLRDIKITQGMDILRCKSPALVHKELAMHTIAYNLTRALMLEAARRHGAQPLRLSFAGALATIRQWAPALAAARSRKTRATLLSAFFRSLARDVVPWRPNRHEPRARKRRPKNYQLLNRPRSLFKEIQHRNKYKKPLT